MKNYQIGDTSRAICSDCECVVATTFRIRDVALSDTKELVKDILVAVCNRCDRVVGLPAQSTLMVKESRK